MAELKLSYSFDAFQPAVVPAALGQLKGLRSLEIADLNPCVLEVGCLDLPNLLSLDFRDCRCEHAQVLPVGPALKSLTRVEFCGGQGPLFFDHQLVQLPRLQRMVFDNTGGLRYAGACPWLSRPPADMGSLSLGLRHLSFSGHGLTQFPLALTQLVALEHLTADENEFAEVPGAIMALSRLTELALGRCRLPETVKERYDPLQQHVKRPLDVRALGDLPAFPALCNLRFAFCEVMLCESMLGAVRHASLASICFFVSHPAPERAPTVLQLSQALTRLKRGSVLSITEFKFKHAYFTPALQNAQRLPPLQQFKVALQACGM